MFSQCTDPSTLEGLNWFACYLTTGKHVLFYQSFLVVLTLLAVTAPIALGVGFLGAIAARSKIAPLRWFGTLYTSMVRGVPDIVFFLFVPLALDQGFETIRHKILCPDWSDPIRQGNDFLVCAEAKLPLGSAPQTVHEIYGFLLAVLAFAIVFGAFSANVISGAMRAVPRAQLETAESYGMTPRQSFWRILVPQMWIYALPGLSNLWMILIKSTPLLFLLGVEDIVYWARELGAAKTSHFTYPHPDWRLWYFLALLVFYLSFTKLSEIVLARITARLSKGQATMAGEQQRKAA
ncbi:amino acid ABC transporter membrane protein 1 (PAAT family) [Pacificibacter maritimus]|uniref:Amino acid ABC transporter membrane protein 1 (PAAT family) n=1 Tax=Pacificibacter maritimus TaxID=762213 RepID=A0A3N4UKP5_9RHOB|nr:ABC transporter permease subunit [Pacificibacter maritimus]RPE71013.1 amino acid ABC transporter membrane protein 1 (PAAT family) [Pacificibacter maritimus]